MKFIKLNLYRTLLMCAGFMISAFGSALYVYSGLGADAFNLMVQGVSGVLGLAIGTTSSLIQFIFLALLIFASRPLIGIGTFGGTVLIGMVMNLCEIFLQPQLAHAGLLMRVLCVMLAPIIVGTGVAMVNLASMGMVPNDILSVWLFTRQKKLPYRAVRIIYDVVQLAIGLALGGVVGIGTVLSAVLTGPAIQAASGVLEKLTPQQMQTVSLK